MNHDLVKQMLIEAGRAVRQRVIESLASSSVHELSQVYKENREDTIYQIDRDVEDVLTPILEKFSRELGGIVLIAEGIGEDENGTAVPSVIQRDSANLRVIIDPIDGTRGIMYDKRPAFFLAGTAPNKGESTGLIDVEVAVMVELPTSKQNFSDVLWAIKGQGCHAYRENLQSGETKIIPVKPSSAKTIIGGFAQFARFFPPGREILSAIEDELIETLAVAKTEGKAIVFEDQYISSGGQLYEMLMGHDRFIADVRGLLYKLLRKQGKVGGHVCHPYDVCAHLIGKEAGLIITNGEGTELNAPMDLTSEVNWIAYANQAIEREVKPVLMKLLKKYQLLS